MEETFKIFWPLIIMLAIWEAVWKLIAMWKAGRNNHFAWFICIALINSLGVLSIAYILLHRKHRPKT